MIPAKTTMTTAARLDKTTNEKRRKTRHYCLPPSPACLTGLVRFGRQGISIQTPTRSRLPAYAGRSLSRLQSGGIMPSPRVLSFSQKQPKCPESICVSQVQAERHQQYVGTHSAAARCGAVLSASVPPPFWFVLIFPLSPR